MRASKVGEETTLRQIRRMVAEAQGEKAPIERLLDRYAKLYTPAALILGAILWWWSGDLLRAITVLIVFCPCVMVLATPTALVASVGNAALRGSLIKKGATVEALAGRHGRVRQDWHADIRRAEPRQDRRADGIAEADLLRLCGRRREVQRASLGRGIVVQRGRGSRAGGRRSRGVRRAARLRRPRPKCGRALFLIDHRSVLAARGLSVGGRGACAARPLRRVGVGAARP